LLTQFHYKHADKVEHPNDIAWMTLSCQS